MQLLTLMLYSRLDISSERWWSAVRDDRSCHWKSRGQADLWNSPEQWTTIPPQCLTAQFRALCFRVLARQGAHRQFPFALFQPGDSGRSQQQGHHPERRKDTTTLAMQKQYPDLRGDDFLATQLSMRTSKALTSLTLRRSTPPSDASSLRDLYRLGP